MLPPQEQVRCINPDCQSQRTGGRVLLAQQGSLMDIRMNVGRGQRYELTALGLYLMVSCPSCDQTRINPDAMIFDGISDRIERALSGVVTRVLERTA